VLWWCEDFFEALNNGDKDWFKENLVKKYGYNNEDAFRSVEGVIDSFDVTGPETFISTNKMCELYNYLNNKALSVKSFLKLSRLHLKSEIIQYRKSGGGRERGIKVNMKGNDDGIF